MVGLGARSGHARQNPDIPLNKITQHILVAGRSGSGKTNTCFATAARTQPQKIPFIILDPLDKRDYRLLWGDDPTPKMPGAAVYLKPCGYTPWEIRLRRLPLTPPGAAGHVGQKAYQPLLRCLNGLCGFRSGTGLVPGSSGRFTASTIGMWKKMTRAGLQKHANLSRFLHDAARSG